MTPSLPSYSSALSRHIRAPVAGPSRLRAIAGHAVGSNSQRVRGITSLSQPPSGPEYTPFFTSPYRPANPPSYSIKGKERARHDGVGPENEDPEREVSDREWEIRVGRAMLHLQGTLPHFFHPDDCRVEMFSPEVFSRNMELKLPVPFPVKISSLAGYSVVHTLTRNGMSALFSDLRCSLDRMSFSPSPQAATAPAAAFFTKRIPAHRFKQIRVLLSIQGNPRLPPNQETVWHTSSLYTFSPYSGLITCHEVENIRPLPGEGVGEWLMSRLLGWTSRHAHAHVGEGALPCPVGPSSYAYPAAAYSSSSVRINLDL